MTVDKINEEIAALADKGAIFDGSHTFEELYYHRMVLFSVICNTYPDRAWKSKQHDNGSMYEGFFIVGISTPEGQFSYHYKLDYWDWFQVKEVEKAPQWDGHLASDVVRLLSLLGDGDEKTTD
ncbi:TPA: hypothetical protein ACGO97_001877 [Streptococcus suis]|nr:hypothetical protein [Streptococcus suis]